MSTTHSSLAPLRPSTRLKARCRWSGAQAMPAIDSGDGKPSICSSLPSAMRSSHSLSPKAKRLCERVRGWMRSPASLSSGCATWAMPGSAGNCSIAARSRRGLSDSCGGRGASTMACSGADGS
ncbi:hypothetical protein NB705_003896 [Xanthomonas sacchari]|nr:hypothetical protein [Xanthomonas sacchari]